MALSTAVRSTRLALGRSLAAVTILMLTALASSPAIAQAAGDPSASPTTTSRTGAAPRCISLPGRAVEAVGWSPDGTRLAVASTVDVNSDSASAGQYEHVVTIVDWPSLTQSDAYSHDDFTDVIDDISVGADDASVYFDAALGGTSGLWTLNEAGQLVLLQAADQANLGLAGMQSTAQGLVRLAGPPLKDPQFFNLPPVTPMLRDWSGRERTIGPAVPFGPVWFSPDLHWMVATSIQGQIEVSHDGTVTHVLHSPGAVGVGMTEARTAIVEIVGAATRGYSAELIALDGTAVGWSQAIPPATGKLPDSLFPSLSSQDVLAVGTGDEICLVAIPQTITPSTNAWLIYALFVGVLAFTTLLTSRSGLLDRVRRMRQAG